MLSLSSAAMRPGSPFSGPEGQLFHIQFFAICIVALLKAILNLFLLPPFLGGSRGRVRIVSFLVKSLGFGPIPARSGPDLGA